MQPDNTTITLPHRGLSKAEVAARRKAGQANADPPVKGRTYTTMVRENIFTFVNNILLVFGLLLIAAGKPLDALGWVAAILINVGVNLVQETRAKNKLDRFAVKNRPMARVIREGKLQTIDPRTLVLDDVVEVSPGDQIVVDGTLISDEPIEVDESLLTGETELLLKRTGDPLYSGSFCVTNMGYYRADKVGRDSLSNQISTESRTTKRVFTKVQLYVNLIIRIILFLSMFIGLLLIVRDVSLNLPIDRSLQQETVILGLVPYGLFLTIAAAYALGAVRLAGKGALIQQANGIESLSNVDVFCLDKTGTLTTNKQRFHKVYPVAVDEDEFKKLLGDYIASAGITNATARAIAHVCKGRARTLHDEIQFSSALAWSAVEYAPEATDNPNAPSFYFLGAPEKLMDRLAPDEEINQEIEQQVSEWTEKGRRVLLFAYHPGRPAIRDRENDPNVPEGLIPLGLISLSDELRPDAKETIANFRATGARVKILSGDNPMTVASVARLVGFDPEARVISGADLDEMDELQFEEAIVDGSIFGRVGPQMKARIVRTLRDKGLYVAMTGDGVNDVLALKHANLGIALQSGAQSTRSVADIVLLQDSFSVLPAALIEGQRILRGIQNTLKVFLSRVTYVAILIIAAQGFAAFPIAPAQNGLLSLLTVDLPTFALVLWAPPSTDPIGQFIPRLLRFFLPAGFVAAVGGLFIYVLYFTPILKAIRTDKTLNLTELLGGDLASATVPVAQTALTSFLIFYGIMLLLFVEPPSKFWAVNEPVHKDRRFLFLALGFAAAYVVVMLTPLARDFYQMSQLRLSDYVTIVGTAVLSILLLRWIWAKSVFQKFLQVNLG